MAASSISGGVTSPMSCFPQRNPAPGRRLDRSVMLAKQLSNLLTELSRHSDVTTDTPLDMDQRFESLRGCGRLPRGRENRGRALTNEEIVAAILGLVAAQPGWAGHVATIIARLKPVGGKTDVFGGAATITEALRPILADQTARDSIVAVKLRTEERRVGTEGARKCRSQCGAYL